MSPADLESQAFEKTRQLIQWAGRHFGRRIAQPDIRFDLTGKAAGMAVFPAKGSVTIRYNRTLLHNNGVDFLHQTVPHETAHLVARAVYGRRIRPHGPEWRSVMQLFGAEPIRCHHFEVPDRIRRRMRYFDYRCACQVHRLSAIRHHRSQAGVSYRCRRCGSPLRHLETAE